MHYSAHISAYRSSRFSTQLTAPVRTHPLQVFSNHIRCGFASPFPMQSCRRPPLAWGARPCLVQMIDLHSALRKSPALQYYALHTTVPHTTHYESKFPHMSRQAGDPGPTLSNPTAVSIEDHLSVSATVTTTSLKMLYHTSLTPQPSRCQRYRTPLHGHFSFTAASLWTSASEQSQLRGYTHTNSIPSPLPE